MQPETVANAPIADLGKLDRTAIQSLLKYTRTQIENAQREVNAAQSQLHSAGQQLTDVLSRVAASQRSLETNEPQDAA